MLALTVLTRLSPLLEASPSSMQDPLTHTETLKKKYSPTQDSPGALIQFCWVLPLQLEVEDYEWPNSSEVSFRKLETTFLLPDTYSMDLC